MLLGWGRGHDTQSFKTCFLLLASFCFVFVVVVVVVVVSNLYSHDSQWPIRDNSVRKEKE